MPIWMRWARLGLGLGAALVVLGGSLEGWSAVAYLAGLHGSLGAGLLPALLAVWAFLLSLTLPFAVWALYPFLTAERRALRRSGIALAVIAISGLLLAGYSHHSAQLEPSPAAASALTEKELTSALAALSELASRLPPSRGPVRALATAAPATCPRAPSASLVTIVATFVDTAGAVRSHCESGQSLDAVRVALLSGLSGRVGRGPMQLDVVSGVSMLGSRHAWMDLLKLRPGLDGVCAGGRCLMPWQLLVHGFFSTHRPVQLIPDFQFGVAPEALWSALGESPASGLRGLVRFETRSYVVDLAAKVPRVVALVRQRRRDVVLGKKTLAAAGRAAEQHIVSAQLQNGKFRYTLDPLTGQADAESVSLARQGGTTLVLCELGGNNASVRQAIERSLSAFRTFERRVGEYVALTTVPAAAAARLGESTLPLVSLLACAARERLPVQDNVAGLARFVLALQRPDGGFWPSMELATGRAEPGPEPLYSAGQAILGLVLLERRQRQQPSPELPPLELVQAAVERAMTHVAERYWSHPLRDFFFLEENWHCLAAREAIDVHRHVGYEDFCLDYVRFKARLILREEGGIDADFDGGFGFGNVVPPHNTGAAGLGEALAAALAIQKARGQVDGEDERLLGRILVFLLRQQWGQDNCAVCATREVIGSMSEHTHSLITRIDFAQHAWAALGHGGRILGLTP
jgi:hypothetical protein